MANAVENVEEVKQTINAAIEAVSEKQGFGPREQYKALRGLAFQAFAQLIEAGEFKQLVRDAQLNAKHLPRGWGMVAQGSAAEAEVEAPAAKAPAKRKAKAKAAPVEADTEEAVVEAKPAPRAARRPRRAKEV